MNIKNILDLIKKVENMERNYTLSFYNDEEIDLIIKGLNSLKETVNE